MQLNYRFNTSAVETFLYQQLNKVVSDHVFAGTLPSVLKDEWNEVIVIDCSVPIIDSGALSVTTAYLYVYARPHSDGTKNVALMSELENKVCDVIENCSSNEFVLERLSSQADYDTDINWHRNIFEIIIKIF